MWDRNRGLGRLSKRRRLTPPGAEGTIPVVVPRFWEVYMRSTAFVLSLLCFAGFAVAEEKVFQGYITDDMCAKEHMMEGMNDKECADECVKMGAAYALFVPDDGKMYLADEPKKLEPHAGENVVVTGTVSADGKSIQVTSIKKVETSR